MRYLKLIPAIALLAAACSGGEKNKTELASVTTVDTSGKAKKDTTKKSIPAEAAVSLGGARIKISYHAPAVRGRTIWGGLVAYDGVWVTGAHKATRLDVSSDFSIGKTSIPAGSYALFTIPGKEVWTVIINKNWNQHLADDYDEGEDIARIQVKPQTAEMTERLRYDISTTGERTANITMSWEKLKVTFPLALR